MGLLGCLDDPPDSWHGNQFQPGDFAEAMAQNTIDDLR
jgi:hypothetical protein